MKALLLKANKDVIVVCVCLQTTVGREASPLMSTPKVDRPIVPLFIPLLATWYAAALPLHTHCSITGIDHVTPAQSINDTCAKPLFKSDCLNL